MQNRGIKEFAFNFLKDQLCFFIENLIDHKNKIIPETFSIITKKATSTENMLHDLGDYIQYLHAADQITGGKYSDKIRDILGWALEQHPYRETLSVKKSVFGSTIDIGDFLVGLNCMLYADLGELFQKKILKGVDQYLKEFYGNKKSHLSRLTWHKIPIPVVYWYSIFNDIEELIYIYEYTGKDFYLQKALDLYELALRYRIRDIPTIGSFINKGLNALLKNSGLSIYKTILSKTMSNFCSASIKISKYYNGIDILKEVLDPLIKHFWDNASRKFSTYADRFDPATYNLGQNHPALALFIDYDVDYYFNYISIIKTFIEEFGTIPSHFFYQKSLHVDSIVDFATILLKLSVKTSENKYFQIAYEYLVHISNQYRTSFGYVIQGDGKMTECTYNTKFQSLVMKPYILAYEMADGKNIIEDRFLFLLSRDR